MRDAHLIYLELPDEKIRVRPEPGYVMIFRLTKAVTSEAIITEREIKHFYSAQEASPEEEWPE